MEPMLRGEADAGEHLLAVPGHGARRASGDGLRERRRLGARLLPGRVERGLERLHRDQGFREPVAHGLEARDRTTELHRAPARGYAPRSSIARQAPAIWCATARRPRATAEGHAAGSRRVAPAALPCTRIACRPPSGSTPCTARTSAAAAGTTSRPWLRGRAAQATSSSRARAARAVASPVAWRSLPSMRPGASQAANGGSRTARSARGSSPERRREHVVERRGRRVRGAERAEDDADGVVRLRRGASRASRASRGRRRRRRPRPRREGVRDRPAHRLLHRGALFGVDHSSLPSSRSRRAMMLRCTSAVPP